MSGMPMKLILTQEVTGLGEPGDVVEVAAGYGRNYLVPRGVAMLWTRGAEKQIELIRRARSAREIRGLDDAKAAATKLAAMTVHLRTRAGGTACRRRPRHSPPLSNTYSNHRQLSPGPPPVRRDPADRGRADSDFDI
jgi:hypothetical protein